MGHPPTYVARNISVPQLLRASQLCIVRVPCLHGVIPPCLQITRYRWDQCQLKTLKPGSRCCMDATGAAQTNC